MFDETGSGVELEQTEPIHAEGLSDYLLERKFKGDSSTYKKYDYPFRDGGKGTFTEPLEANSSADLAESLRGARDFAQMSVQPGEITRTVFFSHSVGNIGVENSTKIKVKKIDGENESQLEQRITAIKGSVEKLKKMDEMTDKATGKKNGGILNKTIGKILSKDKIGAPSSDNERWKIEIVD